MVFDSAKFRVDIEIECVTRIPYSSGSAFVRYDINDSTRPEAHGRTRSRPLHHTEVIFGDSIQFKKKIRVRSPSKYLRPCMMKFEVVWEPPDSKSVPIGTLSLDLSQFVNTQERPLSRLVSEESWHKDKEKATVEVNQSEPTEGPYDRRLLYMLHGARTNCLLGLKIKVDPTILGGGDYKVAEFDGPAVNYKDADIGAELNSEGADGADLSGKQGGYSHNREKLRKLRASVNEGIIQSGARHSYMDAHWIDINAFLRGESVSIVPAKVFENLHRDGIYDPSELDVDSHKRGTPYLETEIQSQFVSWNVL